MRLLEQPTRSLFFTGKGGMGKTSIACATAVALAGEGRRVLVVSTDPASNLDEVLETEIGQTPTPINGVERLFALNLDPEAAAARYRERVVEPYRGLLPDTALASIEEQLSGACTVEIAAFDEFAKLLGDPATTARFEHVVFDTAPTGHTLRLLRLPSAWTGFIATNTTGASCLGPLAGLEAQRSLYEQAIAALVDPGETTLVLVARPEASALTEAERTSRELAAIGVGNQQLVLNGVFAAANGDPLAEALEERQRAALAALPATLAELPRTVVPLLAFAPLGADALARVFSPPAPPVSEVASALPLAEHRSLAQLADELAAQPHGLVMTVGKGGVGKTTIASALAVELARRGHSVHLSTTDPAAHLEQTIQGAYDGLTVSRIDPEAEAESYRADVLATAGADLDADARALLEEDLRSPCTEEIAVFRAFARAVAEGEEGIVVMDTAPTGHTLLLLDAAEAYHREVLRTSGDVPEEVARLLPRLRDPEFTRVLVVTLPEATPVHEAGRLADDLARAGITPYGWVINQSFAARDPYDPVLAARAAQELPQIDEVDQLHERVTLTGWDPEPPVGAERLAVLVGGAASAAASFG